MKSIRNALTDHDLSRISDQIESVAKKSIRLSSEKRSSEATNRLGGKPNLPKDFNWPTRHEQPLAFVAQLDLATLPRVPDLPLPRTGSLSFFYEGSESAWGFSPDDAGSGVVLYMQESLSSLPLRFLPEELEDHLRFTGVKLFPQPLEVSVPGLQDQALERLPMSPQEREAYYDFRSSLEESKAGCIHRIGGFPDCVQGDPKLEAHLVSHGLYCGDQSGYKTGKKKGLYPGASDWELLLQVDSDDKSKMMWGDMGRIYFLIHKSELARSRFEKTWGGLSVFVTIWSASIGRGNGSGVRCALFQHPSPPPNRDAIVAGSRDQNDVVRLRSGRVATSRDSDHGAGIAMC